MGIIRVHLKKIVFSKISQYLKKISKKKELFYSRKRIEFGKERMIILSFHQLFIHRLFLKLFLHYS